MSVVNGPWSKQQKHIDVLHNTFQLCFGSSLNSCHDSISLKCVSGHFHHQKKIPNHKYYKYSTTEHTSISHSTSSHAIASPSIMYIPCFNRDDALPLQNRKKRTRNTQSVLLFIQIMIITIINTFQQIKVQHQFQSFDIAFNSQLRQTFFY